MRTSILFSASVTTLFRTCAAAVCLACATGAFAAPVPVACVVFDDVNGDGVRQGGEAGLAGIRLTNGVDVLVTGPDGTLQLDVDTAVYRFVTMTSPAGYRPTTSWYHFVDAAAAPADTACFGLTEDPRRAGTTFTWVQFADTQITSYFNYDLSADLDVIDRIGETPLFIMNCGDIVDDGANAAEWDYYVAELGATDIPVYHVVGNHDDAPDHEDVLDNYERYVGPPYYSFEIGNFHFIGYNMFWTPAYSMQPQEAWFANDAANTPPGMTKILFGHFMFRDRVEAWQQMWISQGVDAVFSGHHHATNFSRTAEGVGDYTLVYTRRGGRDWTARSYNLVTCYPDGTYSCDVRPLSVDHRAILTAPNGGDHVVGEDLLVHAEAYDDAVDVANLDLAVFGPGGQMVAALPLRLSGRTLWQERLDTSQWAPGTYRVDVSGSFRDGTPISLSRDLVLAQGDRQGNYPIDDWPMFRRDAQGTAATSRPLRPPLVPVWTAPAHGMVAQNSPVVRDGRVYLGSRNIAAADESGVTAYDAASGRILWQRPVTGGTALAPGVFDGAVVANAMNDSVLAFSASTGNLLWRMPAPGAQFDFAAPVGDAGQVLVGSEPYAYLVAPASGQVIWQSEFIGETWFEHIYSAAAMTGSRIYLNSFGRPDNTTGGFSVLDRADGTLVTPTVTGAFRPALVVGDTVYVVGGDTNDEKFTARDPLGNVLWTSPVDIGRGIAAPGYAKGIVVFAGRDGAIKGLDAATGTEIWSHDVGEAVLDMCYSAIGGGRMSVAAPAIADDIVYIGSLDGRLYALDLFSGTKMWSWDFGSPVASSAAISGNMLFVGCSDGNLYAFRGGSDFEVSRVPETDRPETGLWFRAAPYRGSNGAIMLQWRLASPQVVDLKIYDVRGRVVATLASGRVAAGERSLVWNGRGGGERPLASGVYIARLRAGGQTATAKFALVH